MRSVFTRTDSILYIGSDISEIYGELMISI